MNTIGLGLVALNFGLSVLFLLAGDYWWSMFSLGTASLCAFYIRD